jgi:hypothetical protein
MDKFEQHINRMKGLRDVYEAGTGQHNILSMLITECEIALRQPPVVGRSEQLKAFCDFCEHLNTYEGLEECRFDFMLIDFLDKSL